MAHAAYIYHLYRNNIRIISATRKNDLLDVIHNKGLTSQEYDLRYSTNNEEGESLIHNWRKKPKVGELVVVVDRIDNKPSKIIKVDNHNHTGSWNVTVEKYGEIMVRKWNEVKDDRISGFWEEYQSVRKARKAAKNQAKLVDN